MTTKIAKPRMRQVTLEEALHPGRRARIFRAWLCVGNGTYAYHEIADRAYMRWRGKVALQYGGSYPIAFTGDANARR